MCALQVELTEEMQAIVDRMAATGRHSDAAEVVSAALKIYEEVINRAAALDSDLVEAVAARGIAAIESGEFKMVDGPEGAKELLERLRVRKDDRRTLKDFLVTGGFDTGDEFDRILAEMRGRE